MNHKDQPQGQSKQARLRPCETTAKQAIVLIVVLGVLTILVTLGTTFVVLAAIDRGASKNYADYVQARLHAQSGIHYAIIQARNMLTPEDLTSLNYYGEDLNTNETMDGGVENQDGDGLLEIDTCPLNLAVRPSLIKDINKDGQITEADLITISNKKLGVSGFIPSAYRIDGDYFSIKIEDLSGRIYVNMEDHDHLQNILENLAEELGLDRSAGQKIYASRPYVSLEEIKTKAGLTESEYNKMKQYLTILAWCDKTVVKPVPLLQRVGTPSIGSILDGWEPLRPKNVNFPLKTSGSGYVGEGAIAGRAPVNINTASKEVLTALIRDLKGFYFREPAASFTRYDGWRTSNPGDSNGNGSYNFGYYGSQPYVKMGRLLETTPIGRSVALQIAEAIVINRNIDSLPVDPDDYHGIFRSWHQFNLFVETELATILTSQQERDVLKTNFNPNTNLNDFNPDHNRRLWVDKTDLTYYSTEFCFYPTGYYNLNSLGRVLSQDNKVLAEAEIRTVVKLFEIYKQTNQAQFAGGSISPKTAFGPTYKGLSLQVMPELPEYAADAAYDGYITLATTENSDKGGTFRVHFGAGLNADSGQAMMPDTGGPYKDKLIPSEDGYAGNRGKLFPDGVYSEYNSVPGYAYQPSDWNSMMVSMWMKPHFYPEDTERIRWYVAWRGSRGWGDYFGIWNMVNASVTVGASQTRFSNITSFDNNYQGHGNGWDDNCLLGGGMSPGWGIYALSGSPCINRSGSRSYSNPPTSNPSWDEPPFQAGHWIHLGWIRNNASSNVLYVNGKNFSGGNWTYSDASSPGALGNMHLGERITAGRYPHPADSTIDEVLTLAPSASAALAVWNDGRYYLGGDGAFTSGEIDLGKETNASSDTNFTIFLATWTVYPADTMQPIYPLANGSDVEVQISNGNLMKDYRGSVPEDYEGGPFSTSEPFSYKALFKPQIDINKVVIDSLIFDDITLYYYSEPKLLSWNYVR